MWAPTVFFFQTLPVLPTTSIPPLWAPSMWVSPGLLPSKLTKMASSAGTTPTLQKWTHPESGTQPLRPTHCWHPHYTYQYSTAAVTVIKCQTLCATVYYTTSWSVVVHVQLCTFVAVQYCWRRRSNDVIAWCAIFTSPESPTNFSTTPLNSTARKLRWQPPSPEQRNSVVTQYMVNITRLSISAHPSHTQQKPVL